MIVGCDRNELLGLLLTNDISVQLLFDLVGSRNIIDGKDRLFAALFFLFYLGAGLAKASSGAKNIPQIEEADRRAFPVFAVIFHIVRFILFCRGALCRGICPDSTVLRGNRGLRAAFLRFPVFCFLLFLFFARRLVCGPGGSRISGLVVISGHHAKWESSTEQVEKISRRR